MNLRDYVENRMERENKLLASSDLKFSAPKTAGEIVDLYRTYDGLRRKMRPLDEKHVEEYLSKGFSFAGAYLNKELIGIAVSKKLPENYEYFALPKNETKGDIYTLGGLYVRDKYQGLGIASKLTRIVTEGTKDFAQNENDSGAVGMAYEVSYDNFGSLKILSKYGNYVGLYDDSNNIGGLSIMLYKPFLHDTVKIDNPNIQLSTDERQSRVNLEDAVVDIANQDGIGGYTMTSTYIPEEDNTLIKISLNSTPSTVPEQTFEIVE